MLKPLAAAVRSTGVDPYHVLRKAGLASELLERPNEPLASDRFQALLDMAAEVTECWHIGLLASEGYSLGLTGPIGMLVRQQPTLGATIEAVCRYLGYWVDAMALDTEALPDGGRFVRPVFFETAPSRQFVEMIVGGMVRSQRSMIGDDWRPAEVWFSHEAPADLTPYRAALGQVEFNQPDTGIRLTKADLERPIAGADPAMAQEIVRFIEERGAPAAQMDFRTRVRDLVGRLLPQDRCSIEEVARHFGVDRRTIHRRLVREGVSFSDLVETARRDIAMAQLNVPGQPLSRVARRLGFASLSTFSRWFNKTYGMGPSEFRRPRSA